MSAFGRTDVTSLLTEGLRVAQFNQRIIANNIANADTPNYNAARVDFQTTLQRAVEGRDTFDLRRTQSRHIDMTRPRPAVERNAVLSKNDRNKVSLDEEMVNLRVNTGRYTTYAGFLNQRFTAISDMLTNLR